MSHKIDTDSVELSISFICLGFFFSNSDLYFYDRNKTSITLPRILQAANIRTINMDEVQ